MLKQTAWGTLKTDFILNYHTNKPYLFFFFSPSVRSNIERRNHPVINTTPPINIRDDDDDDNGDVDSDNDNDYDDDDDNKDDYGGNFKLKPIPSTQYTWHKSTWPCKDDVTYWYLTIYTMTRQHES